MASGHSPGELDQAAIGISYRIDQMVGAIEALAFYAFMSDQLIRFAAKDPRVQNALIESALVNARVLAYFLSKKPGKEVVAGDFLPAWTPRSDLGRLIGLISDHLTHAKHIPPPGQWELATSLGD